MTGTDAGVGKTIVTAALAAIAAGRVAVVKPAQTGVRPGEPGDIDVVRAMTGIDDVHEHARMPDALAPATSARLRNVPLPDIAEHEARIDDLARTRDRVLVEGAGGLLVRLDGDGADLAGLAARLATPFDIVVVVRAGLGTLNHTALTVDALRSRGLPIAGLVIGSWPETPDLAARHNLADLPATSGAPLLGRIPAGAGRLPRADFVAGARDWLSDAAWLGSAEQLGCAK
ncbi:dethiobiotin synthase [Jiangella mangrovi]|uniref:ATP-dependent dethiobiotin synthetase BioD n=1 Tax=Jiangella mangrovi TaxID=1524084 RepID=A0A7W9GVD6_9ACTN|nr:dethiobiotin synthase [Jiangella mangrovi]